MCLIVIALDGSGLSLNLSFLRKKSIKACMKIRGIVTNEVIGYLRIVLVIAALVKEEASADNTASMITPSSRTKVMLI